MVYSQVYYYYDINSYAGKGFFQDKGIQNNQQVLNIHGCVHCCRVLLLCLRNLSVLPARHHDAPAAVYSLVFPDSYRVFGDCHCHAPELHRPAAFICHKKAVCPDFLYSDGFYFSLCLHVHHCLCLTMAFEQNARTR